MFKPLANIIPRLLLPVVALFSIPYGKAHASTLTSETKTTSSHSKSVTPFKPFTGKIIGSNVRMRLSADLDSYIITELPKDDYIVVTAEKNDFYEIEPPTILKAYIFRGFVIDNIVEGDRVNVRLAPDRDAPIIGHYSTGTTVSGKICQDDNKWLEINIPSKTRFYVAKEYIEYAGKVEMKAVHDKRKESAKQLLEATNLLTQTEMCKPFHEIDVDRITYNFQTIINDYADFSAYAKQATQSLAQFQEDYLHRKIAFLEAKASKVNHQESPSENLYLSSNSKTEEMFDSPTDRMKIWEPIEEALYLSWSAMHHAKTMEDFYQGQKLKAQVISGILEAYKEPVKNKPGDHILKNGDIPIAYVYSTHINLEDHAGKKVTLIVSPRNNNHFAFPAFYVLDVE